MRNIKKILIGIVVLLITLIPLKVSAEEDTIYDEFISNITEYLAESKNKTDRMLNSYNSSEVRPPLSIFSSAFGKENIEACEFMAYGNSEKTRNNSNYEKTDATQTFILLTANVP